MNEPYTAYYYAMSYIIAGLGNPGEEYTYTRHNAGRIILDAVRKKFECDEWEKDKKLNALVSEGKIGKQKVLLVEPEGFMNKSGTSLKPLVTSVKKANSLIVIYDDLDLPIGTMKISFNKSSGGHRGVESIIKNIKTLEFARIRIGISPASPSGKLKKPSGPSAVEKHILGEFKKPELDTLKKLAKKVGEAVEVMTNESREKAMTLFN